MVGGHGPYLGDPMSALVADEELYLEVDNDNSAEDPARSY
jgi:TfoX/Sxy family transcriptional regulator of competence genes